jgi:DNA-binding transcriptional LysR family regulator
MNPIESLSGIVTFVVAARCLSFTAAADKLGISKSAVGKAIARLEERLGVKLFHRTTRRITLTADGEAFFTTCASAVDEISAVESSLGSDPKIPSGRIKIDMPVVFGRRIVLPLLLEIAARYPELRLVLSFNDALVDPIEEGVDLMIRFGELKNPAGVVARQLLTQRWVICASPAYLEQHGTPTTLEEVASHRCIVGLRQGQPLAWHISRNGSASRFVPPPTHQISDGEAMIDAAQAGLGLCQMPDSLLRSHIQAGRLQPLLDAYNDSEVQNREDLINQATSRAPAIGRGKYSGLKSRPQCRCPAIKQSNHAPRPPVSNH